MDTTTKELRVNLESEEGPFLAKVTWIYDMTVPLKSVKSDQLCYEPESLLDQFDKMKAEIIDDERMIRDFRFRYSSVYQAFILEQRKNLIDFIKVYNENHKGEK